MSVNMKQLEVMYEALNETYGVEMAANCKAKALIYVLYEALDKYRAATAKCLMEGCGNPNVWGDELIQAQASAAKYIKREI